MDIYDIVALVICVPIFIGGIWSFYTESKRNGQQSL